MTVLLKLLWSKIGGYVAAIGGVLAFVIGVFLYGRREGKQSAEDAQARKNATSVKRARGVENEVDGLSGPDVDGRLGKWMRDGKR